MLARSTPGMTGADLANLVNEAALLAARRNRKKVTMADFEDAKDKVMMGTERKTMVISDEEKRQIAVHEAGHALVRKFTPGADPVHKVTIVARGLALGVTHFLPEKDRHLYSRRWCQDNLVALLGGRCAEELLMGEMTTGAGNDLERATDLARKMVCNWGMSEVIGPVTFGKKEEQIFLGREISQHQDYSEETARLIDSEVRRLVDTAHKDAMELLVANRGQLENLAENLLEREVLTSDEIDILVAGGILPPVSREEYYGDGGAPGGDGAEAVPGNEENPAEKSAESEPEREPAGVQEQEEESRSARAELERDRRAEELS